MNPKVSHETGQAREMQRRDFMKGSAAATAAALSARPLSAHAAGSDTLRATLIGCGSRGTGDAMDFLTGAEGVELVGLADVFQDRVDAAAKRLNNPEGYAAKWGIAKAKIKIDPDLCFVGFDAYERVMASDVDIVLLTTPPHFRPAQLRAAVEAGKHAFIEKPAAVDVTGIRSMLATADLADEKGISIVVGTQQRRMPHYRAILRRIHDGDIGDIVAGQVYWHWDNSFWHFYERDPKWSDMEWQIRCWPYFTWLSGDHIVEQHLHNVDVLNWAIGTHPVSCLGRGGRQTRTGPEFGNIFDHFSVEYEYPNDVRVASFSSQIKGATGRVGERIVGTKGHAYLNRGLGFIRGENPYEFETVSNNGQEAQFADLVRSIRSGNPINETRSLAESTLMVIMGRMSAYTGRALTWDWVLNASKEDLTPPKYEWGDLPVAPVAVPGKTKLI